jgi:hypothetical protein
MDCRIRLLGQKRMFYLKTNTFLTFSKKKIDFSDFSGIFYNFLEFGPILDLLLSNKPTME